MRVVLRVLRTGVIALAFFVAFRWSQAATLAREGQTLPGMSLGIGILSIVFLISALVTELTQGQEMDVRKDLMWGLSSGGIAVVLSRLF